jgi:putative membrane protein
MTMRPSGFLILAVSASLAAVPVMADSFAEDAPAVASSSAPPRAAGGDEQGSGRPTVSADTFFKLANQSGLTEMKLASLAMDKSQSPDIRQFAQEMQKDHGKASSELKSLADSKHVQIADGLDPEHQGLVSQLTALSGPQFEAAYAAQMVTAHKKAVALFHRAAHSDDPQIAEFAAKTLPTLQHHVAMANDIAAKRKLTAAGAPGATS